jgi:hypothetical protein
MAEAEAAQNTKITLYWYVETTLHPRRISTDFRSHVPYSLLKLASMQHGF